MPLDSWLKVGDPSQRPLLLLHGFMGSQKDWLSFLPALSQQFYCLCPDLPGHGSNQALQLDFAEIAPALLTELSQMGIPTFDLLGYSMGGRIALSLLAGAPDRIRHLLLESTFPGFRHASERQARISHDQQIAADLLADFPAFLERWYLAPLWGGLSESPGFEKMYQRRLGNDPQALAVSLLQAGAAQQPNYWPLLSGMKHNVLFLYGDQDRKYQTIASEINSLNPQIDCRRLSAGHNTHTQSPVAWLETVLNFLQSHQI